MEYISVGDPNSDTGKRIGKYFNNYLISFGEPITSKKIKSTGIKSSIPLRRHMIKILDSQDIATSNSILFAYLNGKKFSKETEALIKEFDIKEKKFQISSDQNSESELKKISSILVKQEDTKIIKSRKMYIDSGGYQIITGHMSYSKKTNSSNFSMIPFIQMYHTAIQENHERIHKIFSLDVNEFTMSKEDILRYNKLSIDMSIELMKEIDTLKDKQLFVVQTRNRTVFDIWKKLIIDKEVYKYYKLWSFGGLVGLKKETGADFSHAIPATMWLLTYQKKYKFDIEQIHFLGQGSKLNFISMGIIEKLFNINMTSDSSQLVRFAKMEHKLPITHRNITENRHEDPLAEFNLIESVNDLFSTTFKHYCKDDLNDCKSFYEKNNKFTNADFSEVLAKSTFHDLEFGELISGRIMEIGLENITLNKLKELHPIMERGRLSKELLNNINLIKQALPYIKSADTESADKMMYCILDRYESKDDIKRNVAIEKEQLQIEKKEIETKEIIDQSIIQKQKIAALKELKKKMDNEKLELKKLNELENQKNGIINR